MPASRDQAVIGPPLKITLVSSADELTPEEAETLAQFNSIGEEDAGSGLPTIIRESVAVETSEAAQQQDEILNTSSNTAELQSHSNSATETPPQTTLSRALDREWARTIVREAAEEQERRAVELGASALLRVKLLRLRFQDNLPIRDIAARWELDPAFVHHQFAKARRDFRRALMRVLERHDPEASSEALDERCEQLMTLLG